MYIPFEKYDQFTVLADFSRSKVSDQLIEVIKDFREDDDLEELLLGALTDPNRTPHGPVEIVDIMTLQLSYRGQKGVAGFVLKGRSFKTIRPADVSHQVFRLRKISDLKFAILGHVGNLLDEAREEFIHTAEDLGVDYTILDSVDFARIAVAFGKLCPRDAKRLQNGRCSCGYRSRGEYLNLFQKDAIKKLQQARNGNIDSGVVIMPTGSGKTRVAAADSYNAKAERVLYVAHTHEILDGAEQEFHHFFGKDSVYRSWEYDLNTPLPSVHLSTIQTLNRNLKKINPNAFDYVIVDEFHHAAASSYRKLLSQVKPKFLLGLTATPFRGDQQDVVELCKDNVIVDYDLRSGIDSGILVPYHYYGCFDDVDYSVIKSKAFGYSVRDLDKTLVIPERDKSIILKWKELTQGLPTLAFCCSRNHAKRVSFSFNDFGVPAAVYLGDNSIDERNDLFERFQSGDIKVLCAVDVLNEGADLPFVECLLFLRPTESKRIFLQQLGRGLRRSPGKEHIIVLDFIGNFYNAYQIVEYFGLHPEEQYGYFESFRNYKKKELLDLPIGCKVEFDDQVIDVFARQLYDPTRVNRHNIAKILIYQYLRTSKRLGHQASRVEVDRYQILYSELYVMVFGSWNNFISIMRDDV